jgi:hypothetical protein
MSHSLVGSPLSRVELASRGRIDDARAAVDRQRDAIHVGGIRPGEEGDNGRRILSESWSGAIAPSSSGPTLLG